MSRGSLARAAVAVLSALAVPAAAAQSVERVRVAGAGVPASFPRGVSLALVSPADYSRASVAGAQGTWAGPAYWASGNRSQAGRASIRWTVTFDDHQPSAKAAALAAPTHGWPLDKKDPISVPHYVGRRVVGTILGWYAITHGTAPNDAAYDAALAFTVAPHALAIVRFQVLDPATDSAGAAGNYLVRGSVLPSFWNRGQVFWALSGVRLVGNLPPTRIILSQGRRHRLAGVVADAFRHPVLRVPVRVEKKIGGGWRRVTATKTNARGAFSVRIGRRGDYRAVAVFRGKRLASPPIFVG